MTKEPMKISNVCPSVCVPSVTARHLFIDWLILLNGFFLSRCVVAVDPKKAGMREEQDVLEEVY